MTIADLNTLARFLTKTNSTSFTNAELLILVNKHYEHVVGRIITETSGADWQFGDRNYEAFPTFTITMSSGVAAYDLNDAASVPLTVYGVEVQDNSGDWHPLNKTSFRKIREGGTAQPEYTPTSGFPREYELRDSQIVLYPAPDNGVTVTLTNGLRLYYLRTADIFTSAQVTTGTKEPGFPSPWHDLLAFGPAYDYAIANGLPFASHFKSEYDRKMKDLLSFMGKRDQDARPTIKPKLSNYV